MLKTLLLTFTVLFSTLTSAKVLKAICLKDDRTPSVNNRIARTLKSFDSRNGCTSTLIGPNCFLTAGHCLKNINITQFNVPKSIETEIQHSLVEDTYKFKKRYGHKNQGRGRDWLIYSTQRNSITGEHPGDLYGWYETDRNFPDLEFGIHIEGYGLDRKSHLNHTLQKSFGRIVKFNPQTRNLHHTADTLGGSSGSAIITIGNDKIVGIHTHGGCNSSGPFIKSGNSGTMIYGNDALKRAIGRCLSQERKSRKIEKQNDDK